MAVAVGARVWETDYSDRKLTIIFTDFKGASMFIDSKSYKYKVKTLIDESDERDDLKIAVAFWGKGAETWLESKSKKLKVICNLTSGGTNPTVIKKIHKSDPQAVKHHDNLHAKVFVSRNAAIIGSANMSTNGLNIESEEFDGWEEAGYLTNLSDDIKDAQKWFDNRWEEAQWITPEMFKAAETAWKLRRDRIPRSSLQDMTPAAAQDHNVYVAFWTELPLPHEKASFEQLKNSHPELYSELDFFAGFNNMKSKHKLISVHIDKLKFIIDGAYEVVEITKDKDIPLQIVKKIRTIVNRPFHKKEIDMFSEKLSALSQKEVLGDNKFAYKPLHEVLRQH